jgi:hypothetical protein
MNGTPNLFGAHTTNGYGDYSDAGSDGDDTFDLVLNGQSYRLLRLDEDVDANPDTVDYRTQDESFLRIRRFDTAHGQTNHPLDVSYWKVWDKNGNVYEFGNTDDSRARYYAKPHEHDCSTVMMIAWKWGLNRQSNVFGKSLVTTYTDNGENAHKHPGCSDIEDPNPPQSDLAFYPQAIVYPNNRYVVWFEFIERSDYNTQWISSPSSQWMMILFERSRLSAIRILQDATLPNPDGTYETLVRRYVLTYNDGAIFPNSHLPLRQLAPDLGGERLRRERGLRLRKRPLACGGGE